MKLYNPAQGFDVDIPYGFSKDEFGNTRNSRGVTYYGSFDALVAQDGIVVSISYNNNTMWGMGHGVLIKHADNLYTFYAHGSHKPKFMELGQRVAAGEHVFKTGKTGKAKKEQLYFEARKSRSPLSTIDPFTFIGPFGFMPGVEPPEQQSLEVTGKMNRATWKALQEALKVNRPWNYYGITDGIPGDITWAALKQSTFIFDWADSDTPDNNTLDKPAIIVAVQRRLNSLGLMVSNETGKWDKATVSALQRALNAGIYK